MAKNETKGAEHAHGRGRRRELCEEDAGLDRAALMTLGCVYVCVSGRDAWRAEVSAFMMRHGEILQATSQPDPAVPFILRGSSLLLAQRGASAPTQPQTPRPSRISCARTSCTRVDVGSCPRQASVIEGGNPGPGAPLYTQSSTRMHRSIRKQKEKSTKQSVR